MAAEGEPQGEDMTQTTTEEDTSCKSNSTIEPATEPTESAAVTINDNKPSPTGNDKDDNDQIQNDPPADVAQTDSKVYTLQWYHYVCQHLCRSLSQLIVRKM